MSTCRPLPIGGLLHLSGLISAEQLRRVLGIRFAVGDRFIGEIFVEEGLVSETELDCALSLQFLVKTGVLSAAHAVASLHYIHKFGGSVVDAVSKSEAGILPLYVSGAEPESNMKFVRVLRNTGRALGFAQYSVSVSCA